MSYRSDAVQEALDEWKRHPEGRPAVYWADVLPPGTEPPKDWCAAFVLWAYHRAGLGRAIKQYPVLGFVGPAGLKPTSSPLPGDIVYLAEPFQHHAMLVSYDPATGMVTTIDGNQPGIKPQVRFKSSNMSFYSIEPLVLAAEAEFSWGYVLAGAAILGAGAYIWLSGVPAPLERTLKRLGL